MTIDIELEEFKNHFSVDLQVQAKKHLIFLHALHKLGITTQYLDEASLEDPVRQYSQTLQNLGVNTISFRGNDRAFVGESLRRYSRLWLPLVARAKKDQMQIDLIPPPDIAWLWHCHRLAPYRYSQHVNALFLSKTNGGDNNKRVFDVALETSHPFVFQIDTDTHQNSNDTWSSDESNRNFLEIAAKLTRDLFEEMYPCESFFGASSTATAAQPNLGETRLLSGFDVVAACQRQATFLWHISGPSFSDETFQREAIANYLRFVKLASHPKRSSRSKMMWLVPTYQIDYMWHTHILSNIKDYHNDVGRITGGAVLDHDDSINDRSEGGSLDTGFQHTKQLWKEVYGCEYFVQGGMYTGEPPAEFYRRDYFSPPKAAKPVKPKQLQKDLRAVVEATLFNDSDALPFRPYNRDVYGRLAPSTNRYKKDYVFGHGSKFDNTSCNCVQLCFDAVPRLNEFVACSAAFSGEGLGYYHLSTLQAKKVLIDRCERKLVFVYVEMIGVFVLFLIVHVLAITIGLSGDLDGNSIAAFLVLYVSIGLLLCPIMGYNLYKDLGLLKQTKADAQRCSQASGPYSVPRKAPAGVDVMEGGGYALYQEECTTKVAVGAAACGFSDIYRYVRFALC